MANAPEHATFNGLFTRLRKTMQDRAQKDVETMELAGAIRSLAKVLPDKADARHYLAQLDEMLFKPGFAESIRRVLMIPLHRAGATPVQIKNFIETNGMMDLTGYSNSLASIYTTVRRMKESGELEEFEDNGQRVFRLATRVFKTDGGYIDIANVPGRNFTEKIRNLKKLQGKD